MKSAAKLLREEDDKYWTQKRVAETLGVDRSTVSRWFDDATNVQTHNGCTARPDARVKINPTHKPIIADRVEAGETQEQVASVFGHFV